MSVLDLSAEDIRTAIVSGDVSATEITQAFLDRAGQVNPRLNAFTLIDDAGARAAAQRIDARRRAGETLGPLAGVPVALKDNLCVRGMRTTAASRILDTFVPPYTATSVERLEAAGAVILGKTNCDEFAMGSSTENSAYGPTLNPWDLERTPGGSSGGSAAAVSAGCAPLALGSDTGGSIRQPGSFCGVVGLKPSYGRVSRYGLLAFASSLDQIGPFTRRVRDAALTLSVIAGADRADATTSPTAVTDFTAALSGSVRGLRVGVPRAFVSEGVDPEVQAAFVAALDVFTREGATLVDIDLPHARTAIPVYYLICTAEASSNLARYDGVKYGFRAALGRGDGLRSMYQRTRDLGFGDEVKRRIMLGTYVLSAGYYDAYYRKAQQVRTLLRRDFDRAYEHADIIAMPTSPIPPFRIGEKTADPLQMYLADIFTVSANLAGLPGISIPCGLTSDRLPIGLQLMGRMFDESTMLRAADAFERATTWHLQRPTTA
jgi:aspartyl-tRNA(Asn)/glutamyl-tRNA(Gln) amidotransferase subunit A